MPDARARLSYALLGWSADLPSRSPAALRAEERRKTRVIAKAAELDPEDELVAWLHAQQCMHHQGCDVEVALARLQRLEADNAAAWLPGIDHALSRGDQGRAEALLAKAGNATHYNDHGADLVRALVDVVGDTPLPDSCVAAQQPLVAQFGWERPVAGEDMALISAWGIALAQASTIGPRKICDKADTLAPRPRESCFAVFTRMAESDSLIARLIGSTRMVEFTASVPEGRQWRERLRDLYWLQENQVIPAMRGDFDARVLTEQGELHYWRARLEGEGRWPAPKGWLPARPHQRALVLTGRRPPSG